MRLGLIRDAAQSPPEFHKITFTPGSAPLLGSADDGLRSELAAPAWALGSSVRSWPVRRGQQCFCLTFEAPPGAARLAQWAASSARMLADMGWRRWWLDTAALARLTGLTPGEALAAWGALFWEAYRPANNGLAAADVVALVCLAQRRDEVCAALAGWSDRFAHLKTVDAFDYDTLAREREREKTERGERIKSLFFSFLTARKRAS